MASLLAAHPDVNGIWHQAGAHASASLKTLQQMGLPLIPMTGENFSLFAVQPVTAIQKNPPMTTKRDNRHGDATSNAIVASCH